MLALVLCLLLASATAARLDDQQLSMGEASGAQPRKDTLMTYYIDIFKPTIELSSRGSGRTDRTGLTVRMSEASVSGYVPVVSPRPSGMTHDVVKTWDALKVRCQHAYAKYAAFEPRLRDCNYFAAFRRNSTMTPCSSWSVV
jgi:hypothetical protein